jgi:hypothetical protein
MWHRNEIVCNVAASSIKSKIKEKYDRWHLVKLFHSEAFGFPEPVPRWLFVGDWLFFFL